MNIHQNVQKADIAAVGTGGLSFFKVIPWPEIAAFCSAMYLIGRFILWLWKLWRGK